MATIRAKQRELTDSMLIPGLGGGLWMFLFGDSWMLVHMGQLIFQSFYLDSQL